MCFIKTTIELDFLQYHTYIETMKDCRFNNLIAVIFIISMYSATNTPANGQAPVFSNEEIQINFFGEFKENISGFKTMYQGYFSRVLRQIEFCQWQRQPPEVQQVMRPDSGFLCEAYILPVIDEKQAKTALKKIFLKVEKHQWNSPVKTLKIKGFSVLAWRFQAGKTRLDHFLVFGKKYNYLLVSSPYGSNGFMEKIIANMRYIK